MSYRDSVLCVLSGGLDSTTMLYKYYNDPDMEVLGAVAFNYGQRHKKELEYAERTCDKLDIPFYLIDLWSSGLTGLLSSSESSLVSGTDVPDGHYAEESMKATIVPNRNMMMLSIACGIAVAQGIEFVATGVHAGDHFIYPDCRPEFIGTLSEAMVLGNEGEGFQGILAPFQFGSKEDIAAIAFEEGVPLDETWSCYKGGEKHCGRCGTCVERLEAIYGAQNRLAEFIPDMTEYEDTDFWKEAIANA